MPARWKTPDCQGSRHRRGRAGRRVVLRRWSRGSSQEVLRPDRPPERASTRMRSSPSRGHPAGVLGGEVGCAAAGRDATEPGYRDPGRHCDRTNRAQHHHPDRKSQTFSTRPATRPASKSKVVQMKRPLAADNKLLGNFILDGIPPGAAAYRRSRSPSTSTPTASCTSARWTRPPDARRHPHHRLQRPGQEG